MFSLSIYLTHIVAREAERQSRRELVESFNNISKQQRAQLFTTAATTWKETRPADLAPKTLELYKLAISHLKDEFGAKLLSDISADDFSRYQARRIGEGAAARTVNMETGVLRQIMRRHKF